MTMELRNLPQVWAVIASCRVNILLWFFTWIWTNQLSVSKVKLKGVIVIQYTGWSKKINFWKMSITAVNFKVWQLNLLHNTFNLCTICSQSFKVLSWFHDFLPFFKKHNPRCEVAFSGSRIFSAKSETASPNFKETLHNLCSVYRFDFFTIL